MSNNAEPLRGPDGEMRPVPEPWWIPEDDVKRALEAELRKRVAIRWPPFHDSPVA